MSIKWLPTKGPKTRRRAEERLHKLLFLEAMTDDSVFLHTARKEIPEEWHMLEMDIEVEAPKQKVTLYLDRAVVAMFRKMGKGYQARINRILESWLQMKMAEKALLEKHILDAVDETRADRDRPDVGEEMKGHYQKVVQHWAYAEGLEDGAKLERERRKTSS